MYSAKKNWTKYYTGRKLNWPSEYLIRIFKGKQPRLNLRAIPMAGKKVCDIGCGEGGNLVFLKKCGLKAYGVEISPEIVKQVKKNLAGAGIKAELKVGANDNIPFKDNFFDFIVSWNACYYMGSIEKDFGTYVKEFARVLKPGGYGVFCLPKRTMCVFDNSKEVKPGYRMIISEPRDKVRKGEIQRVFNNEKEIKEAFGEYFENFAFGSLEDDCFGYIYHWHLMVCQKKSGVKK